MPSSICQIIKDNTGFGNTFLVRFYRRTKEIGIKKPLDVYECHDLFVDAKTMEYLNDKKTEDL